MTYGAAIIARSMSECRIESKDGRVWQYHPQSDRHSKISCWAVMFDLLQESSLLRKHASEGKVAFGINRQMIDYQSDRKKNLDLVVARADTRDAGEATDLASLARQIGVVLLPEEERALEALPSSKKGVAGASVLVALEAKACMTKHVGSLPRLYDELTSSHQTVHGDTQHALAIGLVMINSSTTFVSPASNRGPSRELKWATHKQPEATARVVAKVKEIRRRSSTKKDEAGFDAIGILVVNAKNDLSEITIDKYPPAPAPTETFHYDSMIRRAAYLYDQSFSSV